MSVGDNHARFDAVVAPHLSEAFTLAWWLMRNRADAEDVVQDVCVRAFRAINGYSGGDSRAWVLRIVRNTAYSMIGRRNAAAVVSIDDLDDEQRAQAERGGAVAREYQATPETELIAKANEGQLTSAMEALPLEFRETLVLREIQGLSYNEIAAVTGVPVGTVMSRLARARRRLVATLKDALQ